MIQNILSDYVSGIRKGLRNILEYPGDYGYLWLFLWLPSIAYDHHFKSNSMAEIGFDLTHLLFLMTVILAQMYPIRLSRMMHLCPLSEKEMSTYLRYSYKMKVGFSFAVFSLLMMACMGLKLYTWPQGILYTLYLLILAVEENIASPILRQNTHGSGYAMAKIWSRLVYMFGYVFIVVILNENKAEESIVDIVLLAMVMVINVLAGIRLYLSYYQKAIEAAVHEYDGNKGIQ